MSSLAHAKDFDAIIVGSGPGGASVARQISRKKKRVLILERGGNAPLSEGLFATASILNAVSVSDNLSATSAFTTGGTTAVYFASVDLPPLGTFQSMGIDLSAELAETERELPLTVLPDDLVGERALKLYKSAMELGYPWKKNTMLVDLAKCSSGYRYEAKWNARSYVEEAVAQGATLINRAKVSKVLLAGKRAIGVEYLVQRGKRDVEVCQAFGAKIILAAGGAASPIILRDSGLRNFASSGFYCHPSFVMFGLVSGLKAENTFVASMGGNFDEHIGFSDANCAPTMHRMIMLSQRKVLRTFLRSRSIGMAVMVKEGLGGKLQDNNRYHKLLSKQDRMNLDKGEQIARKIIGNAGGKHIFKSTLNAAHVGGTIRIREHVDEKLQTEYANLHVCDGSMIPETLKIAPTLTLICLGKYLANHLAQSL